MNAPPSDAATRPDLPEGELALVFTDIEGSTRLLQALGPKYPAQLAAHRAILRASFAAHGGVEVDTQGDSFFAVFRDVRAAIGAVVRAQRELHAYPWPEGFALRVRVGLHFGAPQRTNDGYVGLDLHRCARLMSAGYGGQILLSGAAAKMAGELDLSLELRDMGAHQLKDLPHPEPIFELRVAGLPTDFEPLRTIDNRPHNLPLHLSPIVGRQCEIAQLRAQLEAGATLITLLGPGGTGKTRLSLAVAAATRDLWPDGAFIVQLAPIAAVGSQQFIEEAIAGAVARELGVRDDGSQTLAQQLAVYFRERQMLLVLDNFEHLIEGAGVVAQWREGCPNLALLASSRIPLHLRGERQFPVSPLALPKNQRHQERQQSRRTHLETPPFPERRTVKERRALPDAVTLSQFSALALFVERARAVQFDFVLDEHNVPVVAEICARLDGLPLAIELAAARIKLLPPAALLKQLDKGFGILKGRVRDGLGHHRTLRAAIEWSYDLLGDDDKQLFRRLSVFRGGFNLEGAEQVCAARNAGEPLDVLEGVASLLDQSLLGRRFEVEGEPRYAMLETIRQFALEMLEEGGEAETIRARHLSWCQSATDACNAEMRHDFGRALRLFRADADNWRAAWNWSIAARPDEALQLAATATLLWNRAGNTTENYQRLGNSLRAAPEGATKYRCRALQYLTQAARHRADAERYEAHLRRLEILADDANLPEFQAVALDQRMWDEVGAKNHEKARGQGEKILQLRRECAETARQKSHDAREIARCEDELHDAMILHVEVLAGAGRNDEAWALMHQSLALKRAAGDESGLTFGLHKHAQLLAQSGELAQARQISEEVVARAQNSGDRSLMLAYYFYDAATLALGAEETMRARELLRAAYVVFKEDNAELGFVLTLRALAQLHEKAGQWLLVARIWGALKTTSASQIPPYHDLGDLARAALGTREFEAQRELGTRLSLREAIEMAL